MATNLPFCFFIQFLEQLLKFLVNFTLLKYVTSQRSYGSLITKELIFGFQILDLKVHFSGNFLCLLKDVHRRQKLTTDFSQTFELTILVVNISISRKKIGLPWFTGGHFLRGLITKS